MSVAPGARLGAYEVVSHIGSGGMGEVSEFQISDWVADWIAD
jgi:hypothetical protein